MEQTCKPNFVSAIRPTAIIHLGQMLPFGSSDLPENASAGFSTKIERATQINVSLFGLAPRGVCLAANVTIRAGELLPHRFTHYHNVHCTSSEISYLRFQNNRRSLVAGLFSVALVVTRFLRAPGRYPARCPVVFGLSSFLRKRPPSLLHCVASSMLTKSVEHLNTSRDK